jgi:hypothetical protein
MLELGGLDSAEEAFHDGGWVSYCVQTIMFWNMVAILNGPASIRKANDRVLQQLGAWEHESPSLPCRILGTMRLSSGD